MKYVIAILSLSAVTAFAHVPQPRIVQLQPAVQSSIKELKPQEKKFKEKLPIQLTEPMQKIAKAKYKPANKLQ